MVGRHDADGRLVEAASFRAGRLHGPFRLYGPDGSLCREALYVDGRADGLATDYDETGQTWPEPTGRPASAMARHVSSPTGGSASGCIGGPAGCTARSMSTAPQAHSSP